MSDQPKVLVTTAVIVVAIAAVVAVVVMVPVAVVHLPATLVVVIVWMAPVGAVVGWALPDSGTPGIAAPVISPVAFSPDVPLAGHGRTNFSAKGRGRATDVNVNLCDGGGDQTGEGQAACEQA